MPLSLNAEQRRQRARLAGLAGHAQGKTNTAPARQASNARFRKQVIDHAASRGEVLTESEIGRRADFARREFYARMAYQSLAKRRKNAAKAKARR
jgi:hypothetical protein